MMRLLVDVEVRSYQPLVAKVDEERVNMMAMVVVVFFAEVTDLTLINCTNLFLISI